MGSHSATLPVSPAPLVGRDGELGRIESALADPQFRLVTLTGPPGVGKTRLALTVAAATANRFADGVVVVDLTRISREAALGEIGRAVGVGEVPGQLPRDRIIETLAGRELLVVLDNCEHILPLPELGETLAACADLRILAASRERLHLTAEREIAIAPLPVPSPSDRDDPDLVAANPAVALLVSRAKAFHAGFAVTPGNAADLADVCMRLDGLPLALELAAAQLRIFTPGELASRLRYRSISLGGGHHDMPERHKGLRTAISWSHNLMPESERALFRRLAVFVGGWTLPAAEAVCSASSDDSVIDVTSAMTSLLDKSLITRTDRPDGVTAFAMLESIREFAAEQLDAHGEETEMCRRHKEFYASLALHAERGIGTSDEDMWWIWLGYEHGNLRAALEHSLKSGDAASALWLAAAVGWYWYTRGYIGEGHAVVTETITATAGGAGDAQPPADAMAAALLVAGILAWSHRDLDTAADRLRMSRELSERSGDVRRGAIASAFAGHVARDAGAYDEAVGHHERARDIFEQAGNERGIAWAHFDLGLVAWRRGDLDAAAELFGISLLRFRDVGYEWAVAWSSWALAGVQVGHGDCRTAAPLAAEALETFDKVADRRGVAQSLEVVAQIAVDQGRSETAGRLLGAAGAMRRSLAVPGMTTELDARERTEKAVHRSLGRDRAERAFTAGRSLPYSGVVALARRVVGVSAADEVATTARPTPREREVAALVASGCTNREIGRTLGIAEKTTEVHIRNIMGKLGAHSRAEIASWAVANGVYDPERSTS